MNKKVKSFDINSKEWDNNIFYQIYKNKDNEKEIKLIGATDRVPSGKGYLSWVYITYYNCIMLLKNFLMWDAYFQMNNLIENNDVLELTLPPDQCFLKANILVNADGNGSEFCKILDISLDTPCGFYYGY